MRSITRSGWRIAVTCFLRNIVVRAEIPAGTRVLLDGLGQPEGVDSPTIDGGQIVWKVKALPAHSILGPFMFNVLTTGLLGRPQLTSTATVEYAHAAAPQFRGSGQSSEVRVQISNR
jgi:hypothetical protein